ncbi:unnamed protein product [Calypogeia fissa]
MPPSKQRLLLTYGLELVDGFPLHVASNSSPLPWTGKEPAGHAFHEAALRKLGYGQECPTDETPAQEKKEKAESPSVDSFHFKGRKKSDAHGDQQDHYALLGLSHLRFLATEEQIRKSYRDLALKHHPDKQAALLLLEETDKAREEKKEAIDRHFKSIQEAYEILIDPIQRRLYDSIDEFDDEVPSDCSQDDFFKVFGPVFLRNARWSLSQPVPSLGDDSTSIADVDTFYDFWWSFKSWREFPHADEFDLEQAESREHKRWMERQNGKLREKAKKEENGRIRTLIENAYKRDPRILRRKEEEKAEKLRKKEAKVLAKKEKELEAARLVEDERLRKVEEDRRVAEVAAAQKKIREKEKKLLRKERQRLRAAAAAVVAGSKDFGISDDAIEGLCSSLEMAEMAGLCEELENTKDCEGKAEILRVALKGNQYDFSSPEVSNATSTKGVDQLKGEKVSRADFVSNPPSKNPEREASNGYKGSAEPTEQVKEATNALNRSKKTDKPWSKEEVDLLRKAIAKYPTGTSQRWQVVCDYIGTGRTVEEILRAIKTVLLQKPDSSKAFDSFLSKRKPVVEIVSPMSTRDDLDSRASATAAAPQVASDGHFDAKDFDAKGKAGALPNGVISSEGSSIERGSPESQPESNVIATAVVNGNSSSMNRDVWSEMQELALVKALKTFPKDSSQRWERIAAAVPGKTKSQCFKKFAELRENFRSKKGSD